MRFFRLGQLFRYISVRHCTSSWRALRPFFLLNRMEGEVRKRWAEGCSTTRQAKQSGSRILTGLVSLNTFNMRFVALGKGNILHQSFHRFPHKTHSLYIVPSTKCRPDKFHLNGYRQAAYTGYAMEKHELRCGHGESIMPLAR